MFKKIKYKIQLLWHSLFYGMRGADIVINGPVGSSEGVEIIQQKAIGGGVFADMLEEKQTQQVKETVDAYYRVYKEADKWDTSGIKIIGEDENGVIFSNTTSLKKKTKADFMKHPPVFNPSNFPIRTIQDNKHFENQYNQTTSIYLYDTTLNVTRDDFTPRFFIEKLVTKMVVRTPEKNGAIVDLYVPAEASQFGKIDAIIISQLHTLRKEEKTKSDLVDIKTLEWFSDKAWNSEDMCSFKYSVRQLNAINLYDGHLILSYACDVIEDGIDLTAKHRTKELDEKYAIEAPKRDNIDIFTYERHINRKKEKQNNEIDTNNLDKKIIKLS